MRVLVYGNPRANALGRMCARGFRQLGHNTNYLYDLTKDVLGMDMSRLERFTPFERVSTVLKRRHFLKAVEADDPDLVLVIKGYELDRETVEAATKDGTYVVNWNPDNPYQIYSQKTKAEAYLDALPAYDAAYIWSQELVDKIEAQGAQEAQFLPFAHDPTLHRPMPEDHKYSCDLIFLGTWSEKREQYLRSVTDFDVQIYGHRWEQECQGTELEGAVQGTALHGEEYVRALSSAILALNVVGDHASGSANMRTFEIPATDTAMVTNRTRDQQQFFPEGDGSIMYSSPEELRSVVGEHLEDTEVRKEIARRGHELVQDHTYERRMETIVQQYDG